MVTNQQLYLAIGVPIVVQVAMLLLGFTLMISHLDKRFEDFKHLMDKRFDDFKDLWRAELHRVEEILDARLKHLEERL